MSAIRLLVTGGAGFIGYHLAEELLRRGHPIIGEVCHNALSVEPACNVLGWSPRARLSKGLRAMADYFMGRPREDLPTPSNAILLSFDGSEER